MVALALKRIVPVPAAVVTDVEMVVPRVTVSTFPASTMEEPVNDDVFVA